MPRRNRLIRERAKRLQAEIEKEEYKSRTPGGKLLRNQFRGHVRDLARAYTEVAIEELAKLMTRSKSEATRLLAATTILERGWGKPAQAIIGPDEGENPVRVVHEIKRSLVRAPQRADNENGGLSAERPVTDRTGS